MGQRNDRTSRAAEGECSPSAERRLSRPLFRAVRQSDSLLLPRHDAKCRHGSERRDLFDEYDAHAVLWHLSRRRGINGDDVRFAIHVEAGFGTIHASQIACVLTRIYASKSDI